MTSPTPEERAHRHRFRGYGASGVVCWECNCFFTPEQLSERIAAQDERVRQLEAALDEAYEAMTELADLTTNPMLRDSLKAAANEAALVRGLANTQPVAGGEA